jgi:hypothetical protein
VVGLREDAALIPAGEPALEGGTSPFYPTRCKEKGSKRTFNNRTCKMYGVTPLCREEAYRR